MKNTNTTIGHIAPVRRSSPIDGTKVTMPDTPSNQETYPQSRDLAFPSPG